MGIPLFHIDPLSVAIWLKDLAGFFHCVRAMASSRLALDAEWVDGGVEAVVTTKAGHMILWQCWIAHMHDTNSWADFMPCETLRLEAALSANQQTANLTLNDDAWSYDLVKMQQTNLQTGTTRAIRRVVILKQGVLKD